MVIFIPLTWQNTMKVGQFTTDDSDTLQSRFIAEYSTGSYADAEESFNHFRFQTVEDGLG